MDRRILLTSPPLVGLAAQAFDSVGANAQEQSPGLSLIDQFAATLSAHDIDAFAALFADSYVNHQTSAAAPPPAAGVTPKQGTLRFFAGRLKGLPDLKVTIEASVASGDKAAGSRSRCRRAC